MKGIVLNFIQGKAKIDTNGEIKDYNIKQSKKNEIRAEDIQIGMEVEFEFNNTISKFEIVKVLKKNAITTKEKIMIIMSTANQTVNAIPIDILGIKKVVILSTTFASQKGYTRNYVNYLKKKKIAYYIIDLSREEETDVSILAKKIENIYSDLNNESCYLNITGGQKLYVLACSEVAKKTNENISTIYLDIHETTMHVDNSKRKYVANLTLEEILLLYGYTYIKEDAKEWNVNDLKKDVLTKLLQFSNKYINDDSVSKKFFSLDNSISSESSKLKIISNNFIHLLKNIEDLNINEDVIDPIKKANKIFLDNYGEKINDKAIHVDREKLTLDLLNLVGLNKHKLVEVFGTEKNLDTGNLFEKMLLVKVLEAVNTNNKLREEIIGIFTSVKTIQNETINTPTESEYDMVLISKRGTLIILEAKTGKYEGDTAKGKEYGAITKSGPYGKSSFVGPLINRFLNDDGTKKVSYISSVIENHENVCKNTGIKYIRFDNISQELERLI